METQNNNSRPEENGVQMKSETGQDPKKKKNNSTKRVVFVILILACVGLITFAALRIITIQMNYKQAQEEYAALREYTAPSVEQKTEEEVVSADLADEADDDEQKEKTTRGEQVGSKKHLRAPITVDHKELKSLNPDYTGWLYIGSIGASYPVLIGPDDEYYLHRTFDGSYLFAGSLFLNSEAKPDYSDPHTIIYGHNMQDGSMFGKLRSILDNRLYESDPYFWVLTPDGDQRYRIFSMYVCMDVSDTYTIFSGHGEIVKDYITAMKAKSMVDLGDIEYDENSKVITLSTCVHAEGPERFVVQGVSDNG